MTGRPSSIELKSVQKKNALKTSKLQFIEKQLVYPESDNLIDDTYWKSSFLCRNLDKKILPFVSGNSPIASNLTTSSALFFSFFLPCALSDDAKVAPGHSLPALAGRPFSRLTSHSHPQCLATSENHLQYPHKAKQRY